MARTSLIRRRDGVIVLRRVRRFRIVLALLGAAFALLPVALSLAIVLMALPDRALGAVVVIPALAVVAVVWPLCRRWTAVQQGRSP